MPDVCIIPIQEQLFNLYDSGQIRRPIGSYGALVSDSNKTANPVEVALVGKAKPGHKAKYQITYVDAECDATIDCGDSGSGICDAGSSEGVQTDVKTISECFNLKNIEITIDQFRDLCNFGPDAWLMAQLLGRLDTGMQRVNEYVSGVLCAAAGNYKTGANPVPDLNLVNAATGLPNFMGLYRVAQDFRKVGVNGRPIMIGGDSLDSYSYGMTNGGQTQGGARFTEAMPPVFYDPYLSENCPVDDRETVLALQPGVAQFVNYLYNVGEFQTNAEGMDLLKHFKQNDTYVFGVLEDPVTGYMWDMSIVFAPCQTKYIISLKTNFDVWTLRQIQCGVPGYTGIIKYGACPWVAPACTA